MFERILVPIDGSIQSKKALEAAMEIAKRHESEKLGLMHVYSVEAPQTLTYAYPADSELEPSVTESTSLWQDVTEDSRKLAEAILKSAEETAKTKKLPVATLLRSGHKVEEIVKAATNGEYDLIVIGARGHGTIRQLLLGSVSSGVSRHAKCPVLIVK
jgi:nucleotide-binding universal stress UspA family protein